LQNTNPENILNAHYKECAVKKIKNWFRGLSMTGKVTSVAVAALLSFGVMGAAAQQGSTPPSAPAANTTQSQAPAPPKVETKAVTTTEAIPFTSSTIQDDTLAQGTTQTGTSGVNGILTHTFQVTYTDGVETARSAPVDTVTTPAVNEVLVVGTKAPAPVYTPAPNCPNSTYVNSAGNVVCSPYESNSAPAGASAQCSDGTYSFSQSRSGTCSHHGGVAVWL
jgi:hypothetical protein